MKGKLLLEKQDFSRPFVGINALIFKRDGKGKEYVLLGKRKNVFGAGHWHTPGGHLKIDETFEEGLKREVFEETGLRVKKGRLLWVEENFLNTHHVVLYFEAILDPPDQTPKNLEPEKCYGWRWFSLDNLPSPLLTLQDFFKQYKNKTRIENFGKASRDFIGVGVAAVIMDEEGRVLMQKRGGKASNEVGKWKFPGGRIEYREKAEDALKREMKEELGVEVEIEKFLFNLENYIPEEGEYWFVPVYLCRIKKGRVRNMEPEKCEEIAWFDIESLPENVAHGTREIVAHVKRLLKKDSKF